MFSEQEPAARPSDSQVGGRARAESRKCGYQYLFQVNFFPQMRNSRLEVCKLNTPFFSRCLALSVRGEGLLQTRA